MPWRLSRGNSSLRKAACHLHILNALCSFDFFDSGCAYFSSIFYAMIRLLTTDDQGELLLESFQEDYAPPYAILSHTWLQPNTQEPTFQDITERTGRNKAGFEKVRFCLNKAKEHGLNHAWIDSCCIDKESSAELSRAINSMFRWYQNAARCYVYLSDVSVSALPGESSQPQSTWESAFRQSRYWSRGWTLQEMIAPSLVEFFSHLGARLGDKRELEKMLSEITGIPLHALRGAALSSFSYDERKRWAARRTTTEPEDMTYCLLGLLEISMPAIYGEGQPNANHRLDREIQAKNAPQPSVLGKRSSTLQNVELLQSKKPRTEDPVHLDAERISELVESLRFDQIGERHLNIRKAHARTCRWLRKTPQYIDWNDPKSHHAHHGFLWIKGKPGSGKSTLMKYAREDAVNALKEKNEDTIVLSFFFNGRGSDLEKSIVGAYLTLLSQLLEHLPHLQRSIFSVLGVAASRIGTAYQWTTQALQDLLQEGFRNLGGRSVVCFIDALDECIDDEIREMVSFFENVATCPESATERVRICLASRHYPHITTRWDCLELTLEGTEGHNQDIEAYISSELRIGKSKAARQIRADLMEKASGIFMWVVLVVGILNKEHDRGQMHKIRQRLKDIPADLHTLFRDILTRDASNKEEMLICVQWILFAKTPLSLKQLYGAIRVGLDDLPPGNMDSDEITSNDQRRFLLNASKGLAEETRGKNPTVQFIHESVRDFLLKADNLADLWPELPENVLGHSHARLSQCCEAYMRVDLKAFAAPRDDLPRAISPEAKALRASVSSAFPFLEYAAQNLHHHVEKSLDAGIRPKHFFDQFQMVQDRWRDISVLLAAHETTRDDVRQDSIYVFARGGFSNLLHYAVGLEPMDSQVSTVRDALERAIQRAQLVPVSTLLDVADNLQYLPSNESVISLFKDFISKKKRIAPRFLEKFPLRFPQHFELLKECLVHLRDPPRALYYMREKLLDKCEVPDTKKRLFEFTVSSKMHDLVSLLLDKWGNDPSIAGTIPGRAELIYAAASSYRFRHFLKNVLRMNCDTDANWSALAQCCKRMLKLSISSDKAHDACLHLVEYGADSGLSEEHGYCAVFAAWLRGTPKLVHLLLRYGILCVDPHELYKRFDTAIRANGDRSVLLEILNAIDDSASPQNFFELLRLAVHNMPLLSLLVDSGAVNNWSLTTVSAFNGRFLLPLLQASADAGLDTKQLSSALIRVFWDHGTWDIDSVSDDVIRTLVDLLIRGATRNWQHLGIDDTIESYRNARSFLGLPEEGVDLFLNAVGCLTHPFEILHVDCVQFLLDIGIDPNFRTMLGETLLQCVLCGRADSSIDIVRLLLVRGADVHAKPIFHYGSPLFEGFRRCSIEIVKLLLEHTDKLQGDMHFYTGYGYEKDALLKDMQFDRSSDPRPEFEQESASDTIMETRRLVS